MARYTGPSTKIARKFGEPIFGGDKYFEKRNYPPGQHGLAAKRKKMREYGIQLKEKQKVRYMYGLLERQFHNTYLKASRMAGQKGEKSLEVIQKSVASATKYSWIEFDPKALSGKFLNIPTRADIPETINEQLIVDLYSK